MRDPHELTADLPAPRDDEPASLRRDIVDELRDHLECALHRELHHDGSRGCISADQSHYNAEHRVLTRFGNPAAIARRLWWDAMKETIMSQRITAGMASLAAIACCAMFVLMWQTQAANRALVQESQALNSRLLEQMQALAEGLRPAGEGDKAPSEWNRLRLKCVADRDDGPPLAGVRVFLTSASENTGGIPPAEVATGEDGIVDFGLLLYGQYAARLETPNGLQLSRTISVRPGHDVLETIVCPAGDGLAELTLHAELPADMIVPDAVRGRTWYLCQLWRRQLQGEWSRPANDLDSGTVYWFVGPSGESLVVSREQADRAQWKTYVASELIDVEPTVPAPEGPLGGLAAAVWRFPAEAAPGETVRVEPGEYEVSYTTLCVRDETDQSQLALWELIVPDTRSRAQRNQENTAKVRLSVHWGQENVAAFRLESPALQMVSSAVADHPEMQVATLVVEPSGFMSGFSSREAERMPRAGGLATILAELPRRAPSGSRGTGFGFGSQSQLRRLVSGVEVLSYQEVLRRSSGARGSVETLIELRAWLRPEEFELLSQHSSRIVCRADPEGTERTSLDPEVLLQLEMPRATDEERARAAFDRLDADQSGTVTPGELQQNRILSELFGRAGVAISQPVSAEEFEQLFNEVVGRPPE